MAYASAATKFIVAEPEEGQPLPTPREFLDGASLTSKYGTLTLRSCSGATMSEDGSRVFLDYDAAHFTTGPAGVYCSAVGTYSAQVGDTLYLT